MNSKSIVYQKRECNLRCREEFLIIVRDNAADLSSYSETNYTFTVREIECVIRSSRSILENKSQLIHVMKKELRRKPNRKT